MGYKNNELKQYTADRFKQYLITRSVAAKMALELCLAGKIELKDIPTYTDKFTLLHFGQIQVEPEVDREILRISVLDKKLDKEKRESKKPEQIEAPEPTDEDAEAALRRQQYEDDQQRAEDEANDSEEKNNV